MKKHRISPRRFRKIIASYKSRIDFLRDLHHSATRDSQYYFDLWLELLVKYQKLRKWYFIEAIFAVLVSVCLILVIFFF